MINAEYISLSMGGKKVSGGNYLVNCPAGNHSTPKLYLKDKDDGSGVLVKCMCGCEFTDIVAELKSRDLWPKRDLSDSDKREITDKLAAKEYAIAKQWIEIYENNPDKRTEIDDKKYNNYVKKYKITPIITPKKTGKTLFPDQEKIIHDTREVFKQGVRRLIIMAPCGFGKTFVSSEIIKMFKNKKPNGKALFLCDRISLCEQTGQEFYKLGHRVAIMQQGWRGDSSPDILIASVQSIEKAPRLPEVDLIFHDESHVLREYIKRLMREYNNVPIIGLSATPWSSGLGAPGHYETIVKGPAVQQLIDNNRLTPSEVWCPSQPDLTAIGVNNGEFNQKQLAEVTAKRVGEVVNQWFELGLGQQTIISAVNCADSIATIDKLVSRGIKAVHVDYKTTIKQMYGTGGIIDQFKAEEIQVLSSVFKLSIGIDLPNCTCTMAAAPTKSLIREIQFRGRGIRTHLGKEFTTHIDMVGNTERLCDITDDLPDHLDRGKKPTSESPEYEKREPALCKAVVNGKLCNTPKNGNRTCPICGFTPTPDPGIEYIDGKLVKKSKKPVFTKEQKQKFYSMLLSEMAAKNKSESWLKANYRERFKVWPQGLIEVRKQPDQEFIAYMKKKARAYAIRMSYGERSGKAK